MNILLKRIHFCKYGIDGELHIYGQKVCDTLEHPMHHLAPGTYPVRIHTCPHYRRKMPVICLGDSPLPCASCKCHPIGSQHTNLPRFCPQIKVGHGVHNRMDGSILVGKLRLRGLILHSADTFTRLIDRLDKAQNRSERITLTIQ